MKIACLGWGSLVWDQRTLRAGTWEPDGPSLPIEFARAFDNGEGRLTLVLTPEAAPVPVMWSLVDYPSSGTARKALCSREGCRLSDIGIWPAQGAVPWLAYEVIGKWGRTRGFDCVIWTALPPKFGQKEGVSPSSDRAAITYLESRSSEVLRDAEEDVRKAPVQVRTPFRAAFEQHFGWTPTARGMNLTS